jgi:hypothetical protein
MEYEAEKAHIWTSQCQNAISGINITKKQRAETPQPGSEFKIFKPWLSSNASHGWTGVVIKISIAINSSIAQ